MTFRIRGLVWNENEDEAHAASPITRYEIDHSPLKQSNWCLWTFNNAGQLMRRVTCDSMDHGKQLAEADYLSRITPALEPVEPDAELVEALTLIENGGFLPKYKNQVNDVLMRKIAREALARRGKGEGGGVTKDAPAFDFR